MTQPLGRSEAEDLLPLKPVVYLLLLALAEEPCHGYGIKKKVEEISEGRVKLDPGTLYRWMGRLLEDGWVEDDERPRPKEDERRRYYRLTPRGRQMMELESRRMENLLQAARHLRREESA
ncbi:MAG TPA: helix-turn-helix transcriptional regulator [Acidobacteriota bacterium]|nr:helix-turn-helix transcriptional regulator [Acidobacteriota bacterium]